MSKRIRDRVACGMVDISSGACDRHRTGTEWVAAGQGASLNELRDAFLPSPMSLFPRSVMDKIYASAGHATNLALTGTPITEEDRARLESAQFKVGE